MSEAPASPLHEAFAPLLLRGQAEDLSAVLPPLLARAERLAAGVILGEHGRRRPGVGDSFWQYRAALPGDSARAIDWRRSARSDTHFVQDKEWQSAQSVVFWVDQSQSMSFASQGMPPKIERAALLTLAAASLLLKGGERVGLTNMGARPMRGPGQLMRLAEAIAAPNGAEYGAVETLILPRHGRAVFLSDFMGDLAPLEAALAEAAAKGVSGALVQVLDPAEEAFPYDGRTVFQSMGGALEFETKRAGDLRARYLDRLHARKDRLAALAADAGWQMSTHHTGSDPSAALLWLYQALEGGR